ncbi:WXG100 family type VII secretion target [Clostridium sp. HBUAS56017]|uniref:WXG100 family type VII secretion target n=1 Tax=Clostridium sp. HBUAS56017 TaxID=2571128 RepID=UPI001177A800|nr:WXG100 family type VII secretion target [Clostridium sp. HBUAS56017]
MAGKIRVTPEELRRSSGQFKNGSQSTQQLLNKLTSEVNKMSNAWEGAAHNSFFEKYKSLQPSLKEFVQVLQDISKQLDGVAKTMEDVDKQIASKLKR